MANKLLKKYGIDLFFVSIGVLLIFSIANCINVIDIAYLICVVYYYIRIKICRCNKYQ